MSVRTWTLVMSCLVAVALVLFAARLFERGSVPLQVTVSGGTATVGAPAPDFSSQTLDGARVTLSRLHGKPVLLNFWATWCTACEVEMPEIQRASERYGSQGMTVLAIDYHQANAAQMRTFLSRVGARFSAVIDPDGRIAAAYGVAIGLPVSVFIDRSGKVKFIQVGQMSESVLKEKVHSVL